MSPKVAEKVVSETLLACLPPGVPPSFRSIDKAEAFGRGRSEYIKADLTMCDGLPAEVESHKWAHGWSHRFIALLGGNLSWEGGMWIRDQLTTQA